MDKITLLKSLASVSLVGTIFAATSGSIWAAVPLSVVQRWQNAAPESLMVTVVSVDHASSTRSVPGNVGSVTTINVTFAAKVDAVHRTASGVVPGAVILVRYQITHQEPPVPGIQQERLVSAGEKTTAYLKHIGENRYELACAYGCLEKL